jgi:hypothetical protein
MNAFYIARQFGSNHLPDDAISEFASSFASQSQQLPKITPPRSSPFTERSGTDTKSHLL